MVNPPPAALAAAVAADRRPPAEDKLEQVRAAVRVARDIELEIKELSERLKGRAGQLADMKQKSLPDLFAQVGIDKLSLVAEGNLPAYDVELKPYYHANISSEWEPERQQAAFAWLDSGGYGDLIKSTYTIFIDRNDRATALRVEEALRGLGVEFTTKLAVPWNTLTAWLKEQVEKFQTTPPLDLLGASVGKVVNLKPRKS